MKAFTLLKNKSNKNKSSKKHSNELSLNLQTLAEALNASIDNKTIETKEFADLNIESVSIDSRSIQVGELYIAIRGERFDGHDFVKQAIDKGAIACVVDHHIDEFGTAIQIVVDNCKLALGKIASLWLEQWLEKDLVKNLAKGKGRDKADIKVIGITGSCGKTTVKEMIRSILEQKFKHPLCILSTQGNLNNEYGVPLTIMQLKASHKVAIIEMGANHQQEIAYLSAIVKPDIAIVTNAGNAHIEGFGSLENVAKGKGEIYSSLSENGIAIINNDDKHAAYWKSLVSEQKNKVMTFALDNDANFCAQVQHLSESKQRRSNEQELTQWAIKTPHGDFSLTLPVPGKHNMANALAAISVTQLMQASNYQIKKGLETFNNISGRLEVSDKQKSFSLINDTYNANPDSVKAAIDVLASSGNTKQVLILGDMAELGKEEISLHQQVGEYAAKKNIDRLFTVGSLSLHCVESYKQHLKTMNAKTMNIKTRNSQAHAYKTVDELINNIDREDLTGAIVIVKGSRKMAMENVVYALEENTVESKI